MDCVGGRRSGFCAQPETSVYATISAASETSRSEDCSVTIRFRPTGSYPRIVFMTSWFSTTNRGSPL